MVAVGAGARLLPHCPTIVSIYFINYISTARPSELPRKEEEGEIILKYLKCLCHLSSPHLTKAWKLNATFYTDIKATPLPIEQCYHNFRARFY